MTKNGRLYEVKTAAPTGQFWQAWQKDKEALKREGYSAWKDDMGNWWVSCWRLVVDESKPVLSSLTAVCPPGLSFRPYQVAGIHYMLEHPQLILADEPGLGKTIQVAGLINALEGQLKRVLIICPAYLKLNWVNELRRWLVSSLSVTMDSYGYATETNGLWVTNYEKVAKYLDENELEISVDLLICDEAHYLKNSKALRTKVVLGQIKAPRRVFVTGTPVVNRPAELWPILKAIDPHGLGSSWKYFHTRYCDAKKTLFGWDVSGASNVEELGEILRSKFMIRRKKSEVLNDLPAKVRRTVYLDSKAIVAALRRERDVLNKLLAEGTDLNDLFEHGRVEDLAELTRARIELAHAKTPGACEMVLDALEAQKAIVVFAWHRDVVEAIAECLRKNGDLVVAHVHGDHSIEQRHEAVARFQAGKIDVLVATIAALGTGVTLTSANQVFFVELPWQPGVLEQAEDRLHRIGQKDTVVATYVLADSPVDRHIMGKITEKAEIIAKMFG